MNNSQDVAAELRKLADKLENPKSKSIVITDKIQPFGKSNWAGTYNGQPAITLSHLEGADLFYYSDEKKGWQKITYSSLAKCHKVLGIKL